MRASPSVSTGWPSSTDPPCCVAQSTAASSRATPMPLPGAHGEPRSRRPTTRRGRPQGCGQVPGARRSQAASTAAPLASSRRRRHGDRPTDRPEGLFAGSHVAVRPGLWARRADESVDTSTMWGSSPVGRRPVRVGAISQQWPAPHAPWSSVRIPPLHQHARPSLCSRLTPTLDVDDDRPVASGCPH